jgi:hypothetical protein
MQLEPQLSREVVVVEVEVDVVVEVEVEEVDVVDVVLTLGQSATLLHIFEVQV